MAYVNLKAELGETVYLVRKLEQDIPEGVNGVLILKSEVHCIEILKDRTTYILKSGHHCSEDELIMLGYPHNLMTKVQEVFGSEA